MRINKKTRDASRVPLWTVEDTEAPSDLEDRKNLWGALIRGKSYVLPAVGSSDVEAWLRANNLMSFLTGANHLNNRRYYAYGEVLADTGKGLKRTFAIVTESGLWILAGEGRKLKFFMAPHSTLFSTQIHDSTSGLKSFQEWTEATLIENRKGTVRSTHITNLAISLAPVYTKSDGHANRRSESVLLAAREPQNHLRFPAVWSGVGKNGRRGVMEHGIFTIAPDGTGKFLCKDFTNPVGDIRLFRDHLSQESDGVLYLKVDMGSSIIFRPEHSQAIRSAIGTPYHERLHEN